MTGKVQIGIKGVRIVDGEREQVDETGTGECYQRDGKHYVVGTSEGAPVKRIKFTGDSMTVTGKDKGVMVFERGRKTRTLYDTPAGSLALEFWTEELCLHEEEDLLEAKVKYSLYHHGDHVSDHCMEVRVSPCKPSGRQLL